MVAMKHSSLDDVWSRIGVVFWGSYLLCLLDGCYGSEKTAAAQGKEGGGGGANKRTWKPLVYNIE